MKHLLLAGLIAWACGSALPVVAVAQAEHAVETAAIDPSWLQFDTATQAVSFQLIAGLTGLNGALNFNGFRDGGLTLTRSEEHTSELQSQSNLVCRLLLEKKKKHTIRSLLTTCTDISSCR